MKVLQNDTCSFMTVLLRRQTGRPPPQLVPGHEAGHSLNFSADVKNACSHTSTPPYASTAQCSNTRTTSRFIQYCDQATSRGMRWVGLAARSAQTHDVGDVVSPGVINIITDYAFRLFRLQKAVPLHLPVIFCPSIYTDTATLAFGPQAFFTHTFYPLPLRTYYLSVTPSSSPASSSRSYHTLFRSVHFRQKDLCS